VEGKSTLRTLAVALIFSGALNIGLIGAGIFSAVQKREISFEIPQAISRSETEPESTNQQILRAMKKLGFRELVSYLTNRDLVEEGYAKRDLALAALVAYHHFHLEKALGVSPEQQRAMEMGGGETVLLFPGLNEEQFEALIRFAYQEKWPLTPEGLFYLVKKCAKPRDASLEQAFYTTSPFYALQVLFQKTEALLPPVLLLDLVSEGSWDLLNRFAREQEQALDLSVDKRRRLLLSYLALNSPTAAQLLLATDFVFVAKKLEDRGILDLLRLLSKTPEAERFCAELLRSPRSDAVWRAATEFVGGTPVVAAAPLPPPLPPTPAKKLHVVKEGENLWKIAKLYRVPHEQIAKFNGLEKDRIYPGMTLEIPVQGTGSEPPG